MKTMAFRYIHPFSVVVHSPETPSLQDMISYLYPFRGYSSFDLREVKTLVCSLGGFPTAVQRQELHRLLGQAFPPVAIMCDDAIYRIATTILEWFNPNLKLFYINQFSEACEFYKLINLK